MVREIRDNFSGIEGVQKRYYARVKARGLCVRCHAPKPTPKPVHCKECLEWMKVRYQEKKAKQGGRV